MGNSLIIAQNISKTFVAKGLFSAKKENHVLHHVDLEIYNNETLALVGESGCGSRQMEIYFLREKIFFLKKK